LLYNYDPTFYKMIKKILIGVDDSTYATHAAKYGFSLAETLGAHVALVHITEPMPIPTATTGTDEIMGVPIQHVDIDDPALLQAQQELSENILERVAKKYGGKTEITHFNEYGSTSEGIIECSQNFKADLIVLGTHHRTGLDRLISGSIAEQVVRHSKIPVLVVPSKE
jgi:nucleotide-binding universal stress UspA family protein